MKSFSNQCNLQHARQFRTCHGELLNKVTTKPTNSMFYGLRQFHHTYTTVLLGIYKTTKIVSVLTISTTFCDETSNKSWFSVRRAHGVWFNFQFSVCLDRNVLSNYRESVGSYEPNMTSYIDIAFKLEASNLVLPKWSIVNEFTFDWAAKIIFHIASLVTTCSYLDRWSSCFVSCIDR